MQREVFEQCQAVLAGWADLDIGDVEFDDPKGFSSFTMGVRPRVEVDPPAVLYRRLAGKENAILDFATERDVFLLLGDAGVAARCLHYDDGCRIEEFYRGRTLTADDLGSPEILAGIADQLYLFHQLEPKGLPAPTFFELLHHQWGAMATSVLTDRRSAFPEHERGLCDDLLEIASERTLEMVMRCLPNREPTFCHNDTYHGNVMLLEDDSIKLLDFEFSCLNHIAFDFANLFAETVMRHGLIEEPHFRIAEPEFGDTDLAILVDAYLANDRSLTTAARRRVGAELVAETRRFLMLSDFMYAMAALPLSVEPIQKIRFLPYASQRFARFQRTWHREFAT